MQHLLTFSFDFLHFETKVHVAESKLEMSCNIIIKPKPFIFLIIVKSFLDRIKQIVYQYIRHCLYFVCLFTHYVYISGFYLYIIVSDFLTFPNTFDRWLYFNEILGFDEKLSDVAQNNKYKKKYWNKEQIIEKQRIWWTRSFI
jgi:hypothetical protein